MKYRVWNIKEERYAKDNDYLMIDCNGIIFEDDEGNIASKLDQLNYIVEYSTGLKDKNGIEIYEGDVLLYKYGENKIGYPEVCDKEIAVYYNEEDCGYEPLNYIPKSNLITFEVIRNIHSHKNTHDIGDI